MGRDDCLHCYDAFEYETYCNDSSQLLLSQSNALVTDLMIVNLHGPSTAYGPVGRLVTRLPHLFSSVSNTVRTRNTCGLFMASNKEQSGTNCDSSNASKSGLGRSNVPSIQHHPNSHLRSLHRKHPASHAKSPTSSWKSTTDQQGKQTIQC